MSEVEKRKSNIVDQLHKLCAHCAVGREHICPLSQLIAEVSSIRGVPLIINSEFRGLVLTHL